MATIIKRYSDQDLQEFQQLLNNKWQEVQQEADSMKERLNDMERQADSEGGQSFSEDSKNHEDREFLSRMYERQVEKAHDLELALTRIANKTYGVDADTGKLISKKRLIAMPTALKSVN